MKKLFQIAGPLAVLLMIAPRAGAAVTLTITEFTTTRFTVTVSGPLEVDAATGVNPSAFVITLNRFVSTPFYTGLPVQVFSNLSTLHPNPTNAGMFDGSNGEYGLLFSYDQTFPQYAGSVFSGSASFSGNFNPAAANPNGFQLWSGYDPFAASPVFSVFHAQAVPEPSTLLFSCAGIAWLVAQRRRILALK
jgi:predicted amidohydrolase